MSFRKQPARVVARRAACLIALAVTLYGAPAFADCEEDVAAIGKLVSTTTNPTVHAQLATVLKQAEKELWEGDEEECATKLSGATSVLKQAAAGQPGNTATP